MLDDFKMGPNVVRGFQPAGIGPRDITPARRAMRSAARTTGAPALKCNIRSTSCRRISACAEPCFVDSGAEWGYKGETVVAVEWRSQRPHHHTIPAYYLSLRQLRHAICRYRGAALVGRRQLDLGLAVRSAAFRFRLSDPETGVRPYPMVPVRRRNAVLIAPRDPRRGWTHAGFLPNQTRTDDRGDRHAHRRQAAAVCSARADASATLRRLIGRGSPTLRFSTTRNISTRWP